MHKPIFLKDIALQFSNKICFENFSTQILPGSRIAILGRNGSGKSSLVQLLHSEISPSSGELILPRDIAIGYVEQTIDSFQSLSGGERFNKRLSEAISKAPDLLLLDEPTNHLDRDNRKSLMRMLQHYQGTLIVATHDQELIRTCVDIIWHIDQMKIHEFCGSYDDYMRERQKKRASIEKELSLLSREKKKMHDSLMKEQKRAAKSKAKGAKSIINRKWPTVVSHAKAGRAEQTSGRKKSEIRGKKEALTEKLSDLNLPKEIMPNFSLPVSDRSSNQDILSINEGSIGYEGNEALLKEISFTLGSKERIAILGKNGSGKSTFVKALLGKQGIFKKGDFVIPSLEDIGYLDQHYLNITPELSLIRHLQDLRPDWSEEEIRRHLKDFLFCKNEEVYLKAKHLSGGEKARFSLSLIAAKTPRLLILDEITNNLDLETKEHVRQILEKYPGAMIIISHEEEFLDKIVDHTYDISSSKDTKTSFQSFLNESS